MRAFRPFPAEQLVEVLGDVKAITVLDRSMSFGAIGGPLFGEVRAAFYDKDVPIRNVIYGLGGRNITLPEIEGLLRETEKIARTGKVEQLVDYLSVRE